MSMVSLAMLGPHTAELSLTHYQGPLRSEVVVSSFEPLLPIQTNSLAVLKRAEGIANKIHQDGTLSRRRWAGLVYLSLASNLEADDPVKAEDLMEKSMRIWPESTVWGTVYNTMQEAACLTAGLI